MTLGWLESLFYGLIYGISQFLPISSEAHRALFLKLTGGSDSPLMRLAIRLAMLLAVLIASAPTLSRLSRERKIAAASSKRRRQPDIRSLLDIRIWRTAGIILVLSFAAYPFVRDLHQRLWILALLLGVNGILLYAPQLLPSANKDSQSLSSWDAVLIGLSAGIGVIPGISRVGASVSVGLMRGAQRRYALDLAMLLSIPALVVLMAFDGIGLAGAIGAVTLFEILKSLIAGIAAFGSAYLGMFIMRFLSVRVGYSGFAYYSWGMALFSFILYLTI